MREYTYPSYRLHRVTQETGGTDVALNAAGGQISKFLLPVKAFNPSKCILAYDITISDGGNNVFNWILANCMSHYRNIRFKTRQNVNIAEINEPGNYSSLVWLPETKFDDFKTFDVYGNSRVAYNRSSQFL